MLDLFIFGFVDEPSKIATSINLNPTYKSVDTTIESRFLYPLSINSISKGCTDIDRVSYKKDSHVGLDKVKVEAS